MNPKSRKYSMAAVGLSSLVVAIFTLFRVTMPNPDRDTSVHRATPISTPRPASRFVLLADTGAASPAQFQVAVAVKQRCSEMGSCRAAFIAGDVIYEEGVTTVHDPQFKTKFEDVYKDIDLPFYLAYGNHDYLGCTKCYIDYSARSTKWRMPKSYYRQDFDDASFWMIDTENFGNEQQLWLQNELTQSTARWKVVVGHRPLLTNESTKVKENWNGKAELKDILCQKANLYVSGHAHILEDLGPLDDCQVQQLVVGGGGAYTREILDFYPKLFNFAGNGFAELAINEQGLTITFLDAQNNQLFQRLTPPLTK